MMLFTLNWSQELKRVSITNPGAVKTLNGFCFQEVTRVSVQVADKMHISTFVEEVLGDLTSESRTFYILPKWMWTLGLGGK